MTAITRRATRRKNDAYYTPVSATEELLRHVHIYGSVLEPCAGEGAIASVLRAAHDVVVVHETDLKCDAGFTPRDATTDLFWDWWGDWDFVVTNPPYTVAAAIVPRAYEAARYGIAFLLRLSYLEPCQNRAQWLAEHPPNHLIVLPRISFTGDGRTDSVCTAWMVWDKQARGQEQRITIVPKGESNA